MTVNDVIDEIATETATDRTDAELLVNMKSALRQIAAFLSYRGFLTEGTITLSAAAQTASLSGLSSAFVCERALWYVKDGQRIPIDPPPSAQYFHSIYTTTGSGKPQYYLIQGTTLRVDKPADEALTIGFDYFKEISAVALGDTFLGDERVVQAAKHLCKAEYYGDYEEDEVKAARNKRDGMMILNELQGEYEDKEMSGYVEIKESDGL